MWGGKPAANITATGVAAYSTLGLFAGRALRAIGWVEFAQGLESVFELFSDPRIHWKGVYLLALIISGTAICFINAEYWTKKWKHYREHRACRWDTTLEEAMNYIVGKSYYGKSLKSDPFGYASVALANAMKRGNLRIAGRKPNCVDVRSIRKKYLENAIIHYKIMGSSYSTQAYDSRLVSADDDKSVLYEGIFVDSRELRRIWPPKPHSGF